MITEKSKEHKQIIIKALSRVPLFSNLNMADLEMLSDLTEIAQYIKGTLIIKEGEIGDRAYILVSGKVKIYKKNAQTEIVLKVAGPCEVFGEFSLIDGLPRSASVVVEEDSLLFILTKENFLYFIVKNPGVALGFLEKMSLRIREQNINLLESIVINNLNNELTREEISVNRPASPDQITNEEGVEEYLDDKDGGYYLNNKYTCPFCQKETNSLVVRPQYLEVVENIDDDMCIQYGLVDPNYYKVIVCTHCKFAFTEESPQKISTENKQQIKQHLSIIRYDKDYSGIRSIEDAITTYLLAITCQTLAGSSNSLFGTLNLKLSCIYKLKGDLDNEEVCLKQALHYLKRAFSSNEQFASLNKKLYMAYIIGELFRHFDNLPEAAKWFKYIIHHHNASSCIYLFKKAQNRWLDIKEKCGNPN